MAHNNTATSIKSSFQFSEPIIQLTNHQSHTCILLVLSLIYSHLKASTEAFASLVFVLSLHMFY